MSYATPPLTLLLCEGYQDRAFLAGLFEELGWAPSVGVGCRDALGEFKRGDYGYRACQAPPLDVRVRPVGGKDLMAAAALNGLKDPSRVQRLVVCLDGDVSPGADPTESINTRVERWLPQGARREGNRWVWRTAEDDQRLVEVRTLVWFTPGQQVAGVPEAYCLERLICGAAAQVWPERMISVQDWLDRRPQPGSTLGREGGTLPKSYSWALMAGWGAEHGCDDFFKQVWRVPELAAAMRSRLEATGAWDTVVACAGPVLA